MLIHLNEFYPFTIAVVSACVFFIDLFVNYLCCIECTRDGTVLHIMQTFYVLIIIHFHFSYAVRPELYTPQPVIRMITCTGKLVLGTVTILR